MGLFMSRSANSVVDLFRPQLGDFLIHPQPGDELECNDKTGGNISISNCPPARGTVSSPICAPTRGTNADSVTVSEKKE